MSSVEDGYCFPLTPRRLREIAERHKDERNASREEIDQLRKQSATDSQTICRLQGELRQRDASIANLRAFIQELESVHQGTLNELAAAKESILGIIKLLEEGDLVRNTENDEDLQKFLAQGLRITKALKAAQDAADNP